MDAEIKAQRLQLIKRIVTGVGATATPAPPARRPAPNRNQIVYGHRMNSNRTLLPNPMYRVVALNWR